MISWWMILVAVLLAILVLGLVFYWVMLYASEEDKNQAWLPKIVVILGLTFAVFNVLLLPYDVANVQNPTAVGALGAGINVELMWQIVGYVIAGMTFLVVPFCMFYYEAYDPDQQNVCDQVKPAIFYTFCVLLIFLSILLGAWFGDGMAEIDYTLYVTNVTLADPHAPSDAQWTYLAKSSGKVLDLKVSIFVYMVGLMSAVGWLLFNVFGGVGLAALPIDLIRDFKNRPQPITAAEYAARKVRIGEETTKLLEQGKELEDKENKGESGMKFIKKKNTFKKKVASLEDAYEKLEVSYAQQGGSVLQAYLFLIAGVLGTIMSICWFFHILLFNLLDVTPFLNSVFTGLDSAFALFGVLGYGLFAFYLLWCTIKGCAKVGVNLLVFTVHPMKPNGTLMNSFLFNTMLILLTSMSVIQFCTVSFRIYASNTAVSMIYATYVANLKGISVMTKYFQYPLLGFTVLGFFGILLCGNRKSDDDDDD